MPNQNLLTAPFSALKQIGEQANAAIQSVGTGMARAASQGLDALIAGAPPIPGMPGAAPGIPTPAQLLPVNLQQALTQVENVLIPPGLPRPSQVLKGQVIPTPQPTPTPAPAQPTGAMPSRRFVAERRGM